jgi:hypothetical protein
VTAGQQDHAGHGFSSSSRALRELGGGSRQPFDRMVWVRNYCSARPPGLFTLAWSHHDIRPSGMGGVEGCQKRHYPWQNSCDSGYFAGPHEMPPSISTERPGRALFRGRVSRAERHQAVAVPQSRNGPRWAPFTRVNNGAAPMRSPTDETRLLSHQRLPGLAGALAAGILAAMGVLIGRKQTVQARVGHGHSLPSIGPSI